MSRIPDPHIDPDAALAPPPCERCGRTLSDSGRRPTFAPDLGRILCDDCWALTPPPVPPRPGRSDRR